MEATPNRSFLPTVPDKNPRTECACHPVAFISSPKLTPLGRFSRSKILAVLLPFRAPLARFDLFGDLVGLPARPAFRFVFEAWDGAFWLSWRVLGGFRFPNRSAGFGQGLGFVFRRWHDHCSWLKLFRTDAN